MRSGPSGTRRTGWRAPRVALTTDTQAEEEQERSGLPDGPDGSTPKLPTPATAI